MPIDPAIAVNQGGWIVTSVPMHPEPVRFTPEQADEVITAIGDALGTPQRPETAEAGGRMTEPSLARRLVARLPGGRIALALQYGHLRTGTGDGYANRARHGLRRVLDIETARATADYLQDLADRIGARTGDRRPMSVHVRNLLHGRI